MNKLGWVAGTTLLLTACGGGGGSDDGTPTQTPPPETTKTSVVMRGPITGFGSVIVNGVRFDVAESEFEIDDSKGHSQDDLQVGQVVTISGTVDDSGNHSASLVAYDAELKGPVESVDVAASRFVALGQVVIVSDATLWVGLGGIEDLAVGQLVEVSGNRNGDGDIEASFVEREDGLDEMEVRGTVAALDAGQRTFKVGSTLVDYGSAVLDPASLTLANGMMVEVEGSLSGDTLIATRVHEEDSFGGNDDGAGSEAEIEGPIRSVSGSSFVIDTVIVVTDGGTVYEHGSAADLVVGARVEAKGSLRSDGSLLADKIEFKASGGSAGSGEIEGKIEAIDTQQGVLQVMGASIAVDNSTVYRDDRDDVDHFGLSSLVVGDWVEVGFVVEDGLPLATRIERDEADDRSQVKGPLDSADPTSEQLVIASVSVDANNARYQLDDSTTDVATFYALALTGSKVKAKGSWNGSTLIASEVELDVDSGDDDHGSSGSDDEPGDDNGGGDDDEPGDDNGGGDDDEPGDDNGGGDDDEPGDDNGGDDDDDDGDDDDGGNDG